MTKFYLTLLTASLFFAGCKTAIKSYNKGNYDDAVELGVKKLIKDPNDADTKGLLKSAYQYAVAAHEGDIRQLSASGNDNRFEAILKEYTQLQNLYNAIHQSPAAMQLVEATDYSEYVQTYRDKAADIHLAAGDRLMDQGSKEAFKNAYYEYGMALKYRNDGLIKAKRDDAYNAAVVRVMVVPIQNYGGYSYHSSYQLQQFQNDVMRTLAYGINNEFIKFYSEWDLQNSSITPDQILEMNLGRISIGRPYDEKAQRQVSKQVVTKEIVYKADSVVKQYATVKATIINTKRTLLSEGELYLTLRDPQGRTLWTDRFTGQHRWQTEFATYTGDERALSESDKATLNKNPNYAAPPEDQIMAEVYRQIESDLSNRLRNYFSRF